VPPTADLLLNLVMLSSGSSELTNAMLWSQPIRNSENEDDYAALPWDRLTYRSIAGGWPLVNAAASPSMLDSPPTRIVRLNRGFSELLPRAPCSRGQRWWHGAFFHCI